MSGGFIFDWWTPIRNLPALFQGLGVTMLLTIVSFAVQVVLGAFLGYVRFKGKGIGYHIVTVYVEIMRNTPLLAQIYVVFFGLAELGIHFNSMETAFLCMILYGCAYTCEIYRGGIQSVDKGQWEAAQCIGLSRIRVFTDIVFPQTLRIIFPQMINELITTLYASSLFSAIGVQELTGRTKEIAGATFRTFEMFTFALIFYYVINFAMTQLCRYINVRYFPSISSRGE